MEMTLRELIVSQIDATMDVKLTNEEIDRVCKGVLFHLQKSGVIEDAVSNLFD